MQDGPMLGQHVCRMHGGKSPQALRKPGALAEQAARRVLSDLGAEAPPVVDALDALERLAGEAVRLVDVLRGMVSDLEEVRYRGGPGSGTEQLRGELGAFLSALGRAESDLGSGPEFGPRRQARADRRGEGGRRPPGTRSDAQPSRPALDVARQRRAGSCSLVLSAPRALAKC